MVKIDDWPCLKYFIQNFHCFYAQKYTIFPINVNLLICPKVLVFFTVQLFFYWKTYHLELISTGFLIFPATSKISESVFQKTYINQRVNIW